VPAELAKAYPQATGPRSGGKLEPPEGWAVDFSFPKTSGQIQAGPKGWLRENGWAKKNWYYRENGCCPENGCNQENGCN
jgi:hypothetical protein